MTIPTGSRAPRPPVTGDIAVHHEVVDPGPRPLVRAVLGLLLGAAAGVVTVLATPPPPGPATAASGPAAGPGHDPLSGAR